jgi:hypothetical protein
MDLFKSYLSPVDGTTNELCVNTNNGQVTLQAELSKLLNDGYEVKYFNIMPTSTLLRSVTVWLHKA